MNELNELIFRSLYDLTVGSVWLKPLVVFAAVYLGWFLTGLTGVIFIRRLAGRRAAPLDLFFIFFSSVGSWFIAQIIKLLWFKPRPFIELAVAPLFESSGNGAFPSGHATFFFALALAVYTVDKKLGQWLIAGATVIGLARVMAGVHWPFDILGGFLTAIFVVSAALFGVRLFRPGFARREEGGGA